LALVGLTYLLTVSALVAVPAQDAFNFIVDLASYPKQVDFYFTITYQVMDKY
jgi:hypothetical protein